MRAGLKTGLAAYNLPKHLFAVSAVPRHASGKGDYRTAASMVEALLAQDNRSLP